MQQVLNRNAPVCVECSLPFVTTPRAQGGGRIQKYCSARCRSNSWARGNTASRQLSIIKYDRKPESVEKKRTRQLRAKFDKYGITEIGFYEMLGLQDHKCAGCFQPLTDKAARIDHNHSTGAVRGLLCNHCNWALGHAKDSPEILRTLANYLEKE